MFKKCSFPGCSEMQEADMCFHHNRVYGAPKAKPVFKQIPKKSKAMKMSDKEYNKFKDEFLSRPENQVCNIQGPGCTIKATCINHRKRRFKDTKMNEEFVEPSCWICNLTIENNHAEAKQTGHLLSKFN